MARIIDLKNRQVVEPKPENGEELDSEQSNSTPKTRNPRPSAATNSELGQKLETRIISWSDQIRYHPKVKAAVLAAIMLFAIAALVQIFQKNIITTIFFAMLGVVILLNAKKKHELGEFEINPTGIKTNNNLLNYRELKSFWIEYDPALGIKELSLQTKKWYLPYVKIPIAEQNPVQLRIALLEFLPEIEHKDTLVEILARKLEI